MFGGVTQSAVKAVGGARFSLVSLTPATFLVGFWAIAAAVGLYTDAHPDFGKIAGVIANPGFAIVGVFGVFVLAVILRPFQAALVQLLEGYWPNWPGASQAAALTIERHRRILDTAEAIAEFEAPERPVSNALCDVAEWKRLRRKLGMYQHQAASAVFRYPQLRPDEYEDDDERLMPTLLGNVLRNGEDAAGDRYGLRFEVVAYRLWPHLSAKLDAENSRNLDMLDTSAAMCICLGLAAISSVSFIWRGDLWALIPVVAGMLSGIAYRGAVIIAKQQGKLQATAIDLHRFDMLTALHFDLPKDPHDEWNFNVDLSNFLGGRTPIVDHEFNEYGYRHPGSVLVQGEPGSSSSDSGSDGDAPGGSDEPDG